MPLGLDRVTPRKWSAHVLGSLIKSVEVAADLEQLVGKEHLYVVMHRQHQQQ